MTPEALIRFARAYCAQKLPWFAPALFQCRIHLTEQVKIAAIDPNFNIYFNPRAIEAIDGSTDRDGSLAQIGFLWIHEISHVLREHYLRSKERNARPYLWNVAADLEINDSDWKGLTMPRRFPGLLPSRFQMRNGQLTEYYYQMLGGKGEAVVASLAGIQEVDGNWDWPDEGSGVHGHSRPWEVRHTDGQQLDEMEVDMVRRSVAMEMKKSSGMGSMPGNWSRWVEDKLQPRVDWRQVLRHRMSVAINQGVGSRIDYSYRRPSRRQAVYHPILPPSLGGDMSARITCVVDTSGSMGPEELGQAVGEVCAVLEAFQIPVTIIPCDARAYEPIMIATPSDSFKLKTLKGGGGTNIIVGIEAALAGKPAPDSVLVLTDGYTPYPKQLYKTPVVFGIFTRGRQASVPKPPNPPWKPDTVVEIPLNGN
ncbi:vWA domain-containing protein [Flavilitoribacter nigricans]|uniref:Metallopeptidase domain-containing protein n=1 Tax=Flavilitoribacter nigricans (strain ATCC 23147 / DSM 23189 / NBRC 102662 / NCIMB 1420 / SS-2) TaxID=1122177 RepID=A0A2D0N4C8_FLAN2|nr:VWA-like domain-containing protein [Flavilitoribacter nigricans]PHN02623.1 hypothetical protein CRP01_31000 [Flavilitoribacter nigricans DSM 23189 = NBRC 102662]